MYTLLLLIKYRNFVIPARSPSNVKKIYFNEKFVKMIELSIKYHDIGKVNTIFQEK